MLKKDNRPGFTLLELLVVLVILAVVSSVLVLSFFDAGKSKTMQATVERVALVLELARTEVVIRNEMWSFHVEDEHYYFKKVDPATDTWNTLEVRPFQPVQIPPDLEFITQIDEEDSRNTSPIKGEQPILILYPSGETSPLELEVRLKQSDHSIRLITDGFQKLAMLEQARQT